MQNSSEFRYYYSPFTLVLRWRNTHWQFPDFFFLISYFSRIDIESQSCRPVIKPSYVYYYQIFLIISVRVEKMNLIRNFGRNIFSILNSSCTRSGFDSDLYSFNEYVLLFTQVGCRWPIKFSLCLASWSRTLWDPSYRSSRWPACAACCPSYTRPWRIFSWRNRLTTCTGRVTIRARSKRRWASSRDTSTTWTWTTTVSKYVLRLESRSRG